MSLIIGIDPSLTGTGIVVLRDGEVELAETTKNRPELGTIERVKRIWSAIEQPICNLSDGEEWQALLFTCHEGTEKEESVTIILGREQVEKLKQRLGGGDN